MRETMVKSVNRNSFQAENKVVSGELKKKKNSDQKAIGSLFQFVARLHHS